MSILRTDSKCEHEDILHDICVFAMSKNVDDELTDWGNMIYPIFRCGLTKNPVLRCPCYIVVEG